MGYPKQQPGIPEAKVLEILIDWLDGMTYRELVVQHKVSKHQISGIVHKAKKQAQAVLVVKQNE